MTDLSLARVADDYETETLLNPPIARDPGDTGLESALAYLGRTLPFLHLPGTPAYDAAVAPWNVRVAPRPVAVVEARRAGDVADAVRFAGRHGIQVAVQATGHGITSEMGGVLLVSTRNLTRLTVDPDAARVRVEAGVTWAEVIAAVAPHGLAGLAGSAPGVGVTGYTTGGGVGPLARTYGLASDRVHAFDVVTGDGQARRATATENPDLFWALRGGKGLLGIITAIEFDLVRQPELYGGAVYFDGARADAVLRRWAAWSADLPREATTSVAVLRLPPMPGVPEPLAGKVSVAVRFAWTGDPAKGAAAFAPMRDAAEPLIDAVAVMPYAALGSIHADPVDPMPTLEQHVLLDRFDEDAVAAFVAAVGPDADAPQIIAEIRQMGGAIREYDEPSAFDQRDAAYSLLLIGLGVPPVVEAAAAHGAETLAAMAPWTIPGTLPNFAPHPGAEGLAATYRPETVARLARTADAYDPRRVIAGSEALGRPAKVNLGRALNLVRAALGQ